MVKATLVLGALGSLSYIAIMLSATVAGLDGDAASGLLGAATFAVVVGLLFPDARLGSFAVGSFFWVGTRLTR